MDTSLPNLVTLVTDPRRVVCRMRDAGELPSTIFITATSNDRTLNEVTVISVSNEKEAISYPSKDFCLYRIEFEVGYLKMELRIALDVFHLPRGMSETNWKCSEMIHNTRGSCVPCCSFIRPDTITPGGDLG